MIRALKSVVLPFLPSRLHSFGLKLRDEAELRRTAQRQFSEDRLRCLTPEQIASIFCDPKITAAWEEDHRLIAKVRPDRELLDGTCVGERRALYYLIASFQPNSVIELGTHVGASTVSMAVALARHSKPSSTLITVDTEDVNRDDGPTKKINLPSPMEALEEIGLSRTVEFVKSSSYTYLQNTSRTFDFAFIDSSLAAASTYNEISMVLSRLNESSLVLLHGYFPGMRPLYRNQVVMPGPWLAGRRITQENPELVFLHLGQLPWATKEGNRWSSLALVCRSHG